MAVIHAPEQPRLIRDQNAGHLELFPVVAGWEAVAEGSAFQLLASFPGTKPVMIPLTVASAKALHATLGTALGV